jgi:hypothetical protein
VCTDDRHANGMDANGMDANGMDANGGAACRNASDALRLAWTALDYLNSPAAGELDPTAIDGMLTALGDLQGKLAAAQASLLRRFDAANADDADGYGSSSAWLAAKGRMTKRDERGPAVPRRPA